MLIHIEHACVDTFVWTRQKTKEVIDKTKWVRVWYVPNGKATDKGICPTSSAHVQEADEEELGALDDVAGLPHDELGNGAQHPFVTNGKSSPSANKWKRYKTLDGDTWLQCREQASGGCKIELPQTLSAQSIRLEVKCVGKCTKKEVAKQLCCPSTCVIPLVRPDSRTPWKWQSLTKGQPLTTRLTIDKTFKDTAEACHKCRTWGDDGSWGSTIPWESNRNCDNTRAPGDVVRIELKVLTAFVDFTWDEIIKKEVVDKVDENVKKGVVDKARNNTACASMFNKSGAVSKYFDAWRTDSVGTIFSSPGFTSKPISLVDGRLNAVALKKVTDFDEYQLEKGMICLETIRSKDHISTECCVHKKLSWHKKQTKGKAAAEAQRIAEARLQMY
jgi:hypothetical protein